MGDKFWLCWNYRYGWPDVLLNSFFLLDSTFILVGKHPFFGPSVDGCNSAIANGYRLCFVSKYFVPKEAVQNFFNEFAKVTQLPTHQFCKLPTLTGWWF